MIPDLPPSVSESDRLDFFSTIAGNLADQSSIHLNWHTHRQNPSTCWICDMSILMSKILQLTKPLDTKSTLDMVTEFSPDKISEPEIEDESFNTNDELDEVDDQMDDQ